MRPGRRSWPGRPCVLTAWGRNRPVSSQWRNAVCVWRAVSSASMPPGPSAPCWLFARAPRPRPRSRASPARNWPTSTATRCRSPAGRPPSGSRYAAPPPTGRCAPNCSCRPAPSPTRNRASIWCACPASATCCWTARSTCSPRTASPPRACCAASTA